MDAVVDEMLFPEQDLNPYQAYNTGNDGEIDGDVDEPFLPVSDTLEIDLTHPDDDDEPDVLPQKRSYDAPDQAELSKRMKSDSWSAPVEDNSRRNTLGEASPPQSESTSLPQSLKVEIPPTIDLATESHSDTDVVMDDGIKPEEVLNVNKAPVASNHNASARMTDSKLEVAPQEHAANKVEAASLLQRSSKQCALCRSKKGNVVLCVGCWIPVHSHCIQGKKYCGSCTIALTARGDVATVAEDPKTQAIFKGLTYLTSITSDPDKFRLVGHVASVYLSDLASIAPPHIKQLAQKLQPQYAHQWLATTLVQVQIPDVKLSTKDITNIIVGLFGLKRSKLSNALTDALQKHVEHYSVVDYLGWDPSSETPDVKYSNLCGGCGLRILRSQMKCISCNRVLVFPSKFEGFRASIVLAYHAEQVGVSIGCSFLDVFKHWPVLRRAYLQTARSIYEQALFCDQWRMICTLLEILSLHGARKLPLELLDVEYKILSQREELQRWVNTGNLDLFGNTLFCLRLFTETPDVASVIESFQSLLLEKQHPTLGFWGYQDAIFPFVDILRYKATFSCLKALIPLRTIGFGPAHVDYWAYLQEWSRQKAIPCGIASSTRRFGNLRDLYRAQVVTETETNPLHAAVQMHLKGRAQPSTTTNGAVQVSSGWMRYTRDVWDKPPTGNDRNVLTMSDLSIFDGLKFEDGAVIDLSQGNGLDEGEDVVDDDDEEETKEDW
ncbi:hypothetical protein LEN26_014010 [Aphanomyces euteiches]|nr:hypothetical protein LEN26_014010 [Aphanomyces euteiches]